MSESIVLMTIGPLLTIVPSIPPLFVGQPGAISFSATGAEGLLRWTLVSSDLPGEWDAALTITDGVASLEAATLATPGSYSVRVRLSDAKRIPVEQTFGVRVVALPIEVSGTLDEWTVTVAITDVLTLSGGTGDYVSVTAISGALPAGASVALVGDELQFSGSPGGTGAWAVVLRVTDSGGAYLDIPLSGTVTALPLSITGGPLDDATEGEAYSDTLTISGGVPPYTLGTVTGVPAGLTVDLDGSTIDITGTPDAGEAADSPFALSIEVEDAEAEAEVYTQSFVVSEPVLLLSDAIIALGPFAYYKLGEGSGATSFADSSGNGFDLGTIVPTVTAGGAGLIAEGTSVDFDGSGYITSGNNEFGADLELAFDAANADGSFSIVCLVNLDDVGSGDKRIFQAGNLSVNNVQGFGLAVNGGNVGIYVKTGGGSIDQVFTSGAPVAVGMTKMLAVTRDGLGATRIFVDGAKLAGPSTTGSGVRLLATDALGGTRITIGASYGSLGGGGTGNMINGRAQHVALFAAELTEAQVLELAEIAGLA